MCALNRRNVEGNDKSMGQHTPDWTLADAEAHYFAPIHQIFPEHSFAEVVKAFQPEAYSQAADFLARQAPSIFRSPMRQVLVVAHPMDFQLNAQAFSPNPRVAIIRMGGGLPAFFRVLSHVIAILEPAVIDFYSSRSAREGKVFLSIEESIDRAYQWADEFAQSVATDERLHPLFELLWRWASGEGDLRLVRDSFEIATEGIDLQYESLVWAGLHHVMAHEFAHHLLGHTSDSLTQFFLDADDLLDGWFKEHDVRLVNPPNPYHREELRADTLAFLTLHGRDDERDGPMAAYKRSCAAVMSSFLAVPALALVEPPRSVSSGDIDDLTSTHPSFERRIELSFRLAAEFGLPNPNGPQLVEAIGRKAPGRPIGIATRFLACQTYVGRRIEL